MYINANFTNQHQPRIFNLRKTKQSTIFRGILEQEFFTLLKEGNKASAVKKLENIKFDIAVKDEESGNNALHYVLLSGSKDLWEKCIQLLDNIVSRIEPEKIKRALNMKNKHQLKPLEVVINEDLRNEAIAYFQKYLPKTTNKQKSNKKNLVEKKESISVNNFREKVGNEVETIDISNISFDLDNPIIPHSDINPNSQNTINFENVIGMNKAKQILSEFIIKPFQNNKPILVNGFLIYGQGDNGKTFLVKSLAEILGKKITPAKKIISVIEKAESSKDNQNDSSIKNILNDSVISLSLDDTRYFDTVKEYISDNFKKNGQQTFIFIDEIAKFFQSDTFGSGRFYSREVPDIMQKFDNFACEGGVLIGTTNNIDYIQSNLLRSNRFQKRIEIKFPNKDERKEVFDKLCGAKLDIVDDNYEKILKKTAGFSYGDLTSLLKIITNENDKISYKTLNEAIENYAKENNFGTLSDEGTTTNYDTSFLRRTPVSVTFSDVAGMEDIKNRFRETIINRLKPEVKQRFKENNRPLLSTNFLLYGPPGIGKTYIIKALAGETKIPLYIIDVASFADKYVGESEKNLKRIFTQLERKYQETGEYSILFLDEANKILGKRDANTSNKDSEYVEQLLQYIDNSFERGIITITATNYKEKMDDAILSRLGEQIKFDYPDTETVQSIVTSVLRKVKIANNITNEQVKEISLKIRGFSSREIVQILTKIIDSHLQYTDKLLTFEEVKYGISKYAQEHELPAINEMNRTSAFDKFIKRLQIAPEDPQSLDEIGGMKDVKQKILNAVKSKSSDSEISKRYIQNRVKAENGILLYGKPGCGKTYIMKALASELNIPIYEFNLGQFGSSYIHKTTENIVNVFKQLKEKFLATGEKSILMLDEFDDIASNRSTEEHSHKIEEANILLKEISNASKNGIIVVAATNYYNKIDDAIKRPGRFVSIEVPLPDLESRIDIIKKELSGREIADKIFENENNFEQLAKITDGFSIVDITSTINRLVKISIDKNCKKLAFEDFYQAFEKHLKEKNNQITTLGNV